MPILPSLIIIYLFYDLIQLQIYHKLKHNKIGKIKKKLLSINLRLSTFNNTLRFNIWSNKICLPFGTYTKYSTHLIILIKAHTNNIYIMWIVCNTCPCYQMHARTCFLYLYKYTINCYNVVFNIQTKKYIYIMMTSD